MFHSYRILILAAAVSGLASAQNTPPVVDAGRDTTIRLGADFRLSGQVADDGLLNADPSIMWAPIDGLVGGLVIFAVDYLRSPITLKEIGIYKLELSASDGEFTRQDTVTIIVLDSIPFLILSPISGQSFSRGDSLLITWQVDPPGSRVLLQFSLDGGLNWEWIVDEPVTNDTRYSWHIPDTLSAPNNIAIRARVKFGGKFTPIVAIALTASGARDKISRHNNLHMNTNQEVFSVDGRLLGAGSNSKEHEEMEYSGIRVIRSTEPQALVAVPGPH